MAEDNSADEKEWTNEEIEETLMEINEAITSGNINEAHLSGELGFHIFANNESDSPLAGFQKTMHIAFSEAIQELWVDEDIVRDYHGEVTPQTICATVEDQMDDFMGFGGLDEAFLMALGRQIGAEADTMSAGKMFSDDNPAEVY